MEDAEKTNRTETPNDEATRGWKTRKTEANERKVMVIPKRAHKIQELAQKLAISLDGFPPQLKRRRGRVRLLTSTGDELWATADDTRSGVESC